MKDKYSFWTLCQEYQKIEVPIIQRDYVQGREGEEKIRESFSSYLIDNLISNTPVELDFVYGSTISTENGVTFIPLDGQQRLSTLFLLHWILAVKEGRMHDIKDVLLKFSYETRPSSHDFCKKLVERSNSIRFESVKANIEDSEWFDDSWKNDPSVTGMLTMIDTLVKKLYTHKHPLLDRLLSDDLLISFYFIPLENFGLTENLYIRMNARGKLLTNFENFKSEFYKIIKDSPKFEEVKDKIEYGWVANLWRYRGENVFVTDKPFMNLLKFVTRMLYFKDIDYRRDNKYETNFVDFNVLNAIYSKEANLDFLIAALDQINKIDAYKDNILWDKKKSLSDILRTILQGDESSTTENIILYAVFSYLFRDKNEDNLSDFVRVVRNLLENTTDNSPREWTRMLPSIVKLIDDRNVYEIIEGITLEGFYSTQRSEEVAKAKIILKQPKAKIELFKAEDNHCFRGNITVLLAANYANCENDILEYNINSTEPATFDISKFIKIFESYNTISENDFDDVWGDLINSHLYTQDTWNDRLTYDRDYKKNSSAIWLAMSFAKSKRKELVDFLIHREKHFIKNISTRTQDLSEITAVKEQLYIYYILTTRIYGKPHKSFFKNGYHFGWLKKEVGFSSLFTNGIKDSRWFSSVNPIFQTYGTQFRYNCGLKEGSAIVPEIIGKGRKNKPFDLLINWVNT